MPVDKLAENIQAVISRIEGRLEKGSGNIAGIALKTTMGPPLMLQFQKA
jgi:large subunit ribosomal protein L1